MYQSLPRGALPLDVPVPDPHAVHLAAADRRRGRWTVARASAAAAVAAAVVGLIAARAWWMALDPETAAAARHLAETLGLAALLAGLLTVWMLVRVIPRIQIVSRQVQEELEDAAYRPHVAPRTTRHCRRCGAAARLHDCGCPRCGSLELTLA